MTNRLPAWRSRPLNRPPRTRAGLARHLETLTEGYRDWAHLSDLQRLGVLTELIQTAEELRRLSITQGRRNGWSWGEIATQIGISRQAAHERYRALDNDGSRDPSGTTDDPGQGELS